MPGFLYHCYLFYVDVSCTLWFCHSSRTYLTAGSFLMQSEQKERAVKFKWGNERAKLHDRLPPIKKNEKHMTWDFWGEIRINNYNTLIVLVSFSHKCVQGFYHRGFQKIYIKSIHFEFNVCNVICLESQTAPRGDQIQHWVSVPNIYHEFYISFNVHNISGKRCTFHLQF